MGFHWRTARTATSFTFINYKRRTWHIIQPSENYCLRRCRWLCSDNSHNTGSTTSSWSLCGSHMQIWSIHQSQEDRNYVPSYLPPRATVNSVQVPVAVMFCYLGSRVTCKNTLDDELTARSAKAGAAFGQLSGGCGKIVEYDSTQKSRCTEQLFSRLCCMAVKHGRHTDAT